MTDLVCRRCDIPHADHPDAGKSGGVGRLLPWDGDLCPVCQARRRERTGSAARLSVATRLDPADDYLQRSPTGPEQRTLTEVLG